LNRKRGIHLFPVIVLGSLLSASDNSGPIPGVSWPAFHLNEDKTLAKRMNLDPKDIRQLRLAAGISDDDPADSIGRFDVRTLGRGHVLLTIERGAPSCVEVVVVAPRTRGYRKVWSVDATPAREPLCRPPNCWSLHVWAKKKGEVEISLPIAASNSDPDCTKGQVLTYRWNKHNYQLAEEKKFDAPCGIETTNRAITLAFREAAGPGETLAMLEVFPSFWPQHAIAIQRTPTGTVVYELRFERPVEFGWLTHRQTPAECIERAKAVAPIRTVLPISTEEAEGFVTKLGQIDLKTDRCPRGKTGECSFLLDGTMLAVWLSNGRTAEFHDIGGLKDIVSENPHLHQWAQALLLAAKNAQNASRARPSEH